VLETKKNKLIKNLPASISLDRISRELKVNHFSYNYISMGKTANYATSRETRGNGRKRRISEEFSNSEQNKLI